jgi:hypothetical protein
LRHLAATQSAATVFWRAAVRTAAATVRFVQPIMTVRGAAVSGLEADGGRPQRPSTRRQRWTSFVAEEGVGGKVVRGLHEQTNPRHRLRVEHDSHTLLIQLSDEDGAGWTTIAVDRATRHWAVTQHARQSDAARGAYGALYDQ